KAKDASIKSEIGDVKFLTQELTTKTRTEKISNKNGFLSKKFKISRTSQIKKDQAVCDLDIDGDLSIDSRDIEFVGTNVAVKGNATMEAIRDFKAVSAEN